jgi:hypothetical protein
MTKLTRINAGAKQHSRLLRRGLSEKAQGLPIPPINPDPKIIIQNEKKLTAA